MYYDSGEVEKLQHQDVELLLLHTIFKGLINRTIPPGSVV